MEDINARGIYTDLIRELAGQGINMYVVSPREKRNDLPTEIVTQNNIKILKVKTGNITKVGMIEKGISTIKIEGQYLKAVKSHFAHVKFDMVMYSTPPITFERVVKYYQSNHNSKTYLVLKDIFPQNAVDINLFKKGSLLWRYFRRKEKRLYEMSDVIGCMSKANLEYILNNNKVSKNKLEVFPNSIKPIARKTSVDKEIDMYREFNIPRDSVLFVYGGNLGKPQGIDFLLEVIKNFNQVENGYLLIVGSGTEYNRIHDYIVQHKPSNINLFDKLPKNKYDLLLHITDVGLIFLDRRFTIPNFPSRLTAYMENSIPILAATDTYTDLKEVLIESNSGDWCESGDISEFIRKANSLSLNKDERVQMGLNGRKYLEENYDVTKTVHIILEHL